jgi:hypothetical protein
MLVTAYAYSCLTLVTGRGSSLKKVRYGNFAEDSYCVIDYTLKVWSCISINGCSHSLTSDKRTRFMNFILVLDRETGIRNLCIQAISRVT